MQQCNKYKSELIQFRKQAGLSTDDIPLDEGIPSVFRTVPPSPGRGGRVSNKHPVILVHMTHSEMSRFVALLPHPLRDHWPLKRTT